MQHFVHLSIVLCLYTALQHQRSRSSNFFVVHISGGISSSPAAFLFLNFVCTMLNSPWVKCYSLMSSWLLIIFVLGLHGDTDYCWCSTSGYISPRSVYNLPWLSTSIIDRSHERKWCHTKKARNKRYLAQTITDTDFADDKALLVNIPTEAESVQYSLELAVDGIVLHVNADKTVYMCFNKKETSP